MHSITGKLNKDCNEFQAVESIGFGINLGVKYYDRQTKQNEWTNYKAVIFAKASAQIDFYRTALIKGAIIEICGTQQKIDIYEGQNGQSITIELLNAQIGYIGQGAESNQTPQAKPQQQAQQAQQSQQQPQAQTANDDDFGDSIPF